MKIIFGSFIVVLLLISSANSYAMDKRKSSVGRKLFFSDNVENNNSIIRKRKRLSEQDSQNDDSLCEEKKRKKISDNSKKLQRRFPSNITSTPGKKNMRRVQNILFNDDEIVQVHSGEHKIWGLTLKIKAEKIRLKNRREINVLQQQAIRGCGPAVIAMFLLDNNLPVDSKSLYYSALVNAQQVIQGLNKVINENGRKDFSATLFHLPDNLMNKEKLFNYLGKITETDSIIMSISDKMIGGHWIVVDMVSKAGITLRDPYHGWCITVTKDAFFKRISKKLKEKIIFLDKKITKSECNS
jgi:hypothetical protein